jgi:hypothetical protein
LRTTILVSGGSRSSSTSSTSASQAVRFETDSENQADLPYNSNLSGLVLNYQVL